MTNPNRYGHLLFQITRKRKTGVFNKWIAIWERELWDHCSQISRIHLKCIRDLNQNNITIQILGKIQVNFFIIWLWGKFRHNERKYY